MGKLKVAVIGCGNISVMHLDSIAAFEDVNLVAVCDIKEERAVAASQKYGGRVYTDYLEMFQKEKLDAVHICLPHYLHVPVSVDAFKNGINVICEKPMSIKYDDAVRAVETAEEYGVQYGIIFQCRYNAPSLLVKSRIEDGKLGTVKCGRTTLTWYRPDNYYDSSDWKGTWDKEGGGVVIDQAIHSLDLANWMINSTPVEIQSALHNRNHKIMVVEDTAEGLIKYANGALLSFYAMNNYLVDEPIEIRLLCENGKATFTYDNAVIEYKDGTVETAENNFDEAFKYSGGKDYWGFQHAVQIRQFYNAVLGKEKLEITGKEALKIQKIVCDIYDNGGMIKKS
ncbi:MAG: Gfo/Idh/MocA family oxidoreductase [Clostridia bacterium]|nr:Gfo/Idh/MocA family oxidoreductase [Clostridia bacterium]